MGTWGQNIALEMLHVSVGICFEGSSCLPKLDLFGFRGLSFKANIL